MAVGKEVEKDHKTGFQKEIAESANDSRQKFFQFFNDGNDLDSIFLRGFWEFSFHILNPILRLIKEPESKSVLEIGYGGGRILNAAAKYFSKAYGVDIHDQIELVADELEKRGSKNVELFQLKEQAIPLQDESIDLVYSFIVFQHLQKLKILEDYIEETYRILKKGGVAVIYVGRYAHNSQYKDSKIDFIKDRTFELFKLPGGYKEINARVNEVNLILTQPFAKKLFEKAGFKVLQVVASKRKIPDGVDYYGGQYGFILQKPN